MVRKNHDQVILLFMKMEGYSNSLKNIVNSYKLGFKIKAIFVFDSIIGDTLSFNFTFKKTVILPVFIWVGNLVSHTKGRKEIVSENRFLRRIFGPKREEVAGVWRTLHNEELSNLYASQNIIRVIKLKRMQWAEHLTCMDENRNTFNILVRKPGGKRPFERSRPRWEENVKMDLVEIGWEFVDWILLAQDVDQWWALVNTVMNLQVP
jgi:hypothetical protein